MAEPTPGPWEPTPHHTHRGTNVFVLQRRNPKWFMGQETLTADRSHQLRRWKTREAAQIAADELNASGGFPSPAEEGTK